MLLCFKIGIAIANHDRRHFRVIRSHNDGPMDHEDKPIREHYDENANKQAGIIPDVAWYGFQKMLEKRTSCSPCDATCNPCVKKILKRPFFGENVQTRCKCHDKPYCKKSPINKTDCQFKYAWLVQKLILTVKEK